MLFILLLTFTKSNSSTPFSTTPYNSKESRHLGAQVLIDIIQHEESRDLLLPCMSECIRRQGKDWTRKVRALFIHLSRTANSLKG